MQPPTPVAMMYCITVGLIYISLMIFFHMHVGNVYKKYILSLTFHWSLTLRYFQEFNFTSLYLSSSHYPSADLFKTLC